MYTTLSSFMAAVLKTFQYCGWDPRYQVLSYSFLFWDVQYALLYHSQRALRGCKAIPPSPWTMCMYICTPLAEYCIFISYYLHCYKFISENGRYNG